VSRRVLRLVERRTRAVRLPRAEAAFLLAHARHLIDVVPAFEPRTYRLTPRGFVGYFDGPAVRYAVGPKIPWPNLRMLLGLSPEAAGESLEAEGGLLAVLSEEFCDRLDAVTRAGLVAGHGTAQSHSPFLRGKLQVAEQLRDAAAGAFPDRFHVEEPVFDLNTPWNRIPQATAAALLRRELPRALRQRIEAVARPLAVVAEEPTTEADFDAAAAEPRAAGYLPLLEVCRLILKGLSAADPLGTDGSTFLIDLGRAFERYLFASLSRELASARSWRAEEHPTFRVGPTDLQPDILIRHGGEPTVVLDAKWKAAGTVEAADLHQVLAYATLTGANRVGLVYPGRSDGRSHFATPDGRVRVSLHRLRVVGSAEELAASVARLARRVRRE
jgi:5-methylcytosine-specific restriction endonuclease McrBC regulatory subunit McrC